MLRKPLGQLFSGDKAGSKIEHEALLFVHRRDDLRAVQHQERLHGRVGNALVSVQERVIESEGEPQRRTFA
jgi:hypothetical protein